jgi:hypothetical protein
MPYGTVNADVIQTSTSGGILGAGNASIMKNRIINGAMVIDQRNAGASITPTTDVYLLDIWKAQASQSAKFSVQQNAGSVTPPAGFTNYLGVTSLSAYSIGAGDYFAIDQRIEGYNMADLDFGKSTAKTITLSFWVRSSLTGTFGGCFTNNAFNRSYPFTYTISVANTWEQKSVTVAGDTTGTWLTTNGLGMYVQFGLGVGSTYSGTAGSWAAAGYTSATGGTSVVGTSGATFYITGVQLEVGSSATGYEYRQYGNELLLCQRYLPVADGGGNNAWYTGTCQNTTTAFFPIPFTCPARVYPTGITLSASAGSYNITTANLTQTACSTLVFSQGGVTSSLITGTIGSGLVAGNASLISTNGNKILFTGCEL